MTGAIVSTHALATKAGADILRAGGNAFDAAVAAGLALQVVEPHLNGPGGDLPVVFWKDGKAQVLCAQGAAPAGATIEHYRSEGLALIPGDGLLATVIPGAFDGWMLLLRDHGTMEVSQVMQAAITLAEDGHPILDRAVDTISGLGAFFTKHWPTSAEHWMPGGKAPEKGSIFRNPQLAATWRRIVDLAQGDTREARIDAARDAFYRGFVADEMEAFCANTAAMDASGTAHKGVLKASDLAGYAANYEAPTTLNYNGWTVAKTSAWGQGPVLLQTLSLLTDEDWSTLDPVGEDFIHRIIEAQKLAFADREVYYADPNCCDVPLADLLGADYAASRRAQITSVANNAFQPGTVPGYEDQVARSVEMLERVSLPEGAVYEPTMAHLATVKRGDTVHLDVADQWGNVVSATPSGGWLQSSPIIPSLGFCLNSRAQMFWLEEGFPASLKPGKRPRTTLSPSLAWHEDGRLLSFGTPGGDQQDQWQLLFFLRYVNYGMELHDALDAPMFHSTHMPASFYPRSREPGGLVMEASINEAAQDALRVRGHKVRVVPEGSVGRVSALVRNPDGSMDAAITKRGTYGGAELVRP
jgi:gamma-glutamyltranspeptidase/glutathione hydrolase